LVHFSYFSSIFAYLWSNSAFTSKFSDFSRIFGGSGRILGGFWRCFLMFFSFNFENCNFSRSLRNIGHGDKIKGWDLNKSSKINEKSMQFASKTSEAKKSHQNWIWAPPGRLGAPFGRLLGALGHFLGAS